MASAEAAAAGTQQGGAAGEDLPLTTSPGTQVPSMWSGLRVSIYELGGITHSIWPFCAQLPHLEYEEASSRLPREGDMQPRASSATPLLSV